MADEQVEPSGATVESKDGQPLVRVPKRRRIVHPRNGDAAPPLEVDDRYHTPVDDVPPEVDDPAARTKPTIGVIELTADAKAAPVLDIEDQSDGVPRTLEDLMGKFPIGDPTGQYYIHVQRRQPPMYLGYATRGVLRKIRRPIDLEGFVDQYGGGEYELIVYGPPKHGGLVDAQTGYPRPKALTKPVKFTVPFHGEGGIPPNPDASISEEDEGAEDMAMPGEDDRTPPDIFRRGVTPANAKLYETHLGHQERVARRNEERERESRSREETASATALQILREQQQQQQREWREEKAELKRKLDELGKKPSELSGAAELMKTFMPNGAGGDASSIRAEHQRELTRINDSHKSDVERLVHSHRAELDTLTRAHATERERLNEQLKTTALASDTRLQQIEGRAAERVRDVEARIEKDRETARAELDRARNELRSDHQRDMDALRREHERALAAQKESYETRLADERRQAERDGSLRTQTYELQVASAKAPLESKIAMLESEVKRVTGDRDHWKDEAAKGKNLGKQIEEVTRTAELLGLGKVEGSEEREPQDWKQIVAGVGIEALKNLPSILENASRAVSAARGARAAPQSLPVYDPMVAPQQQMHQVTQPAPVRHAFATEDSGYAAPALVMDPYMGPSMPAVMPPSLPQNAPPPPMPIAGQPGQQIAQAPQHQMAPLPVPTGMQPTTQAPAAPAPAPPAAPPTAEQALPDPARDAIVLEARPMMESWAEGNAPVAEIAKGLVAQYSPVVVRGYLPALTPASVGDVLTRNNFQTSPLVRRRGQRYLRALYDAITAELVRVEGTG